MESFGKISKGMAVVNRPPLLSRQLWRWYILLFIANELDLVYTYFGLGQGFFQEGNPVIRPHLYTWWPITMKAVALAGLALGIAVVLRAGLRRQQRALKAIRMATAVYAAVLVLHLVTLLRSLGRG